MITIMELTGFEELPTIGSVEEPSHVLLFRAHCLHERGEDPRVPASDTHSTAQQLTRVTVADAEIIFKELTVAIYIVRR